MKAYLILETGDVFPGEWIGEQRHVTGEIVCHTAMNGEEEVLTNPSYKGQLVSFTHPLVGNCGIQATGERGQPQAAAVVMGEMCPHPSPYQEGEVFSAWLNRHGVPGISGIDTRAVATAVRGHKGLVRGIISSEMLSPHEVNWPNPSAVSLVPQVSVKAPVSFAGKDGGPHIVMIDYGYHQSFITSLRSLGCRVTVVPYDWPNERLLALAPDGLILSNGPGDPHTLLPHAKKRRSLLERLPSLAIGLGHQIAAIILGGKTERLPSGHRGSNYPVKDEMTGRVWITEQNHGFTVTRESLDNEAWDVTFVNVNDQSVEGLQHKRFPLQSVQFHPRADEGIFQQFITKVNSQRKETVYV